MYNAAAALADKKADAIVWINAAIEKGWNDLYVLYNDANFEALRKSDEWNNIITKLETKLGVKYDKTLIEELAAVH